MYCSPLSSKLLLATFIYSKLKISLIGDKSLIEFPNASNFFNVVSCESTLIEVILLLLMFNSSTYLKLSNPIKSFKFILFNCNFFTFLSSFSEIFIVLLSSFFSKTIVSSEFSNCPIIAEYSFPSFIVILCFSSVPSPILSNAHTIKPLP